MSERIIPVDELSLHPLPLVPYELGGRTNRHHPAFPANSPLLTGVGGIATRHSMIQETSLWLHEQHHEYYRESPTPLPTNSDEQFDYVAWAELGYIPTHGVDYVNGRPIIKKLTEEHRVRLRSEIRVSSNASVRRFMAHHIVGQDLSHIDIDRLYEFLYADSLDEKLNGGKWLFDRATEVATDRLRSKYKKAFSTGLVDWSHGPKLSEAISNSVFPSQSSQKIFQALRANLELQRIPKPTNIAEIIELRARAYDEERKAA